MNKRFKIDFLQVVLPNGCGKTFDGVITNVLAKPLGPDRNCDVNSAPVRLQEGVVEGEWCAGDMIRIQMDGLPLKAGLDGTANPVDFNDTEGLGHETAFLYNVPLRVLLLQRNRSGTSPECMARYIESHAEIAGPVHLEPVAMPDAAGRLNRMAKVRKLKVRVAGLARAKQFESQTPSVQKMLGLINDMSSMVLELELKAGVKRAETISKSGVISTIKGLLGLPADVATIDRIDVSGRDEDDDKVDTLHLLDFCMTESAAVRSAERHIPYLARAAALREAWKKRQQQLNEMFGHPEA